MINTKELRIGNWVDTVTSGLNIGIQVTGIYEGRICFGDGDEFDPKYVNPIYLSDEILEKAGFEKKVYTSHKTNPYIPEEIRNKEYFSFANDILFIDGENIFLTDDEHFYEVKPKIKYLHELQNLYFAHTKRELILNEF